MDETKQTPGAKHGTQCPKCGAPLTMDRRPHSGTRVFSCGSVFEDGYCDSQSEACIRNHHRLAALQSECSRLKAELAKAKASVTGRLRFLFDEMECDENFSPHWRMGFNQCYEECRRLLEAVEGEQ